MLADQYREANDRGAVHCEIALSETDQALTVPVFEGTSRGWG